MSRQVENDLEVVFKNVSFYSPKEKAMIVQLFKDLKFGKLLLNIFFQ